MNGNRFKDGVLCNFCVLMMALLVVGVMIYFVAFYEPPKKPLKVHLDNGPLIKIPSPDDVGQQAGESAAGFGKGFIKGFRERWSGKPKDEKEEK